MKKLTIIAALVSVVFLSACSDPEEEARQKEAETLKALETATVADYSYINLARKKDEIKAFMRTKNIDESVFPSFQACLSEYVNTKSDKLKATEVMGWCAAEYTSRREKFNAHTDASAFFENYSRHYGYLPLELAIKKVLNDPDSYKHDQSTHRIFFHPKNKEQPYALVKTHFRAKNAFGAMIRCYAEVKVDLKTLEIEVLETRGI